MKLNEEEFEKIKQNWDLFLSLISNKISNPIIKEPLEKLSKELEDRIAACPASTKLEYTGAFTGGLVWHSLNVLKTMKDLNKIYEAKYSPDTLIVVSLFHDIGKIGNEEEDYYLKQESDWHRKNGFMYKVNDCLPPSNIQTRSLWWLNHYGVALSEQEIHAIYSLNQIGQMFNSELYNVPMLTLMLQQSVRFCCTKYKNYQSVLG